MPKGLVRPTALKDTPGSALGVIFRRAVKFHAKTTGQPWQTPRKYFVAVMREVFEAHGVRVTALAKADDFNFAHDVFGIMRHYDERTGKLTGGFSPRFGTR